MPGGPIVPNVSISRDDQKIIFVETYKATKKLLLESYPNMDSSSDAEIQAIVDNKITTAISNLIGGATDEGDTLKELEDRLIVTSNDVDTKIATAVSLLKGENLPESQDTLKELADMIIANANDFDETAVQALIDASISALIGGATDDGDTLKELEDRLVDSIGGTYPLATLEQLGD